MATTHQMGRCVNRSSGDCQKQRRTLRQALTAELVLVTFAMDWEEK
jgi:hypothetical protein